MHKEWPEYREKPPFRSYNIGPALAYNLCKEGTTTRGREKLFDILCEIPKGSNVLLVFGEIDCRAHLGKQADIQKRYISTVIDECVDRYFSVVLEIKRMGLDVGIFGAVPQTDFGRYGRKSRCPSYGTCIERNWITQRFNEKLLSLAISQSVLYMDVFDELTDENMMPRLEYFADFTHLNQKAFPMVANKITEDFYKKIC